MQPDTPRIVVAGSASGVGKTSIACSIIYSLQRLGYPRVQPFKVGPDYIDPGYLSSVSGNDAYNLDVWLMGRDQVLEVFASRSGGRDVSVIEGVMGYYDGFDGGSDYASTHHVASITASPVILVLDAARAARSVAAVATGFAGFHRSSRIAGVILNRIGSARHERLCRDALEPTGIPVVGAVPKGAAPGLESRHLGLVSTLGARSLRNRVERVSKAISGCLDMQRIIGIARSAAPLPGGLGGRSSRSRSRARTNPGKGAAATIGVALDASFNFYYRRNLDALRREGARLEFFSPSSDARPPECDGLYIGGGFPEILGSSLERNGPMRRAVGRLSGDGMPIYAECGGLMYLTRSITSRGAGGKGGRRYRMVGALDAETVMTGRVRLNYTRGMISSRSTVISERPHGLRGHEFHYSRLDSVSPDSRFAYALDVGEGIAGGRDGMVQHGTLASYGHLYFDSADYARAFVGSCARYSRRG